MLIPPSPADRKLVAAIARAAKVRTSRKSVNLGRRPNADSPPAALSSPRDQLPPPDETVHPMSQFGKSLADCALSDPSETVPGPIRKCVEFFRRGDHICFEGIFRVPGSSSAVVRLKNKYQLGKPCTYNIPDDENPTVVASALKTFLFELPEPLIPTSMWYDLIAITDEREFGIEDALMLVDKLPSENAEILFYLLDFLSNVAAHAQQNKMFASNLGMVFGIVLIKPPDNNLSNVGSSMPKEVVSFLVEHYSELFEEEDEIAKNKAVQTSNPRSHTTSKYTENTEDNDVDDSSTS